ncbi:pyroglutamyl-peptidase 1 [Drosophila tropicalis]|uniref:pyroglutamyl-peptidase 1 n=1 Tax=Drosophila tropicalis TaxID=46794 RepID=UPI0035AC1704
MSSERKLVVVSGFGPFIGHEAINASWEAVKLLPDQINRNGEDFELAKQLVSVEYGAVDKAVDEIWARKPDLVIHVGVSGIAKCVYLEKLAYNHQFKRPDNTGEYLKNGTCVLQHNGKANVLRCGLNVDKIVEAVNVNCVECVATGHENDLNKQLPGATKASKNVGSFLCGYIYLKSLDVNAQRSLFVHVPPIDKPFSSAQTADILYKIIEQCIEQISQC